MANQNFAKTAVFLSAGYIIDSRHTSRIYGYILLYRLINNDIGIDFAGVFFNHLLSDVNKRSHVQASKASLNQQSEM